jgi:hypothetical protein
MRNLGCWVVVDVREGERGKGWAVHGERRICRLVGVQTCLISRMLAVSALVFHFVKSLRMALIVHAFQRVQNPSRISKADKLATSATLLLLLSNPAYLDIVIHSDMLLPAAPSAKPQLPRQQAMQASTTK